MRCVLSIDSGGTKCHVILAGEDGCLLGWARTSPEGDSVDRVPGGRGRSQDVVLHTIAEAMGTTAYDEIHVASVGQFPLGFLRPDQPTSLQVHLVSEPMAALRLAGVSYGVCALAGTGAFVHGRTRTGKIGHLDGLGPLLGDHGGGHAIGLRALQATAQAVWHPRHQTSMSEEILAACHIRGRDPAREGLINYMYRPRDRSEIAALARIVSAAAIRGDAVAVRILQEAAADLAQTVYDLVDQLKMGDEEYPFVGTGGVITGSDLYWEHLCAKVREFAPKLTPIRSDLPAVVGVALGALARMPGVDYEAAKRRLMDDVRARMRVEPSARSAGSART